MEIPSQNRLKLIATRRQIFVRLSSSSPIINWEKKDIKNHVVRAKLLSSMTQEDVQYSQSNHFYSQQSQGYISSLQIYRPACQSEPVEEMRNTSQPKFILHLPELQQELWNLVQKCKRDYLSCEEAASSFQQLYPDVDSFVKELQSAKKHWIPLIQNNTAFCNKILTQKTASYQLQKLQSQFKQAEHFIQVLNELKNLKDNLQRHRIEDILSRRFQSVWDKIEKDQITDSAFDMYFVQYIYTVKCLILSFDNQKLLFLQGVIGRQQKFFQAVDTYFNEKSVRCSDIFYYQNHMDEILELLMETFDYSIANDRNENQLVKIEGKLKQSPKHLQITNILQTMAIVRKSLWPNVYEKFIELLSQQNLVCCNEKNFFGRDRINPSNIRILKSLSIIYKLFESHHLNNERVKSFYSRHVGHIKQVISELKLESKKDSHFFKIPILKMLSKYLNKQMEKDEFLDKKQIEGLIKSIEDKLFKIRDKIRNSFALFDDNQQHFILFEILDQSDHNLIPNFTEEDFLRLNLQFQQNSLNQDPFETKASSRRQ